MPRGESPWERLQRYYAHYSWAVTALQLSKARIELYISKWGLENAFNLIAGHAANVVFGNSTPDRENAQLHGSIMSDTSGRGTKRAADAEAQSRTEWAKRRAWHYLMNKDGAPGGYPLPEPVSAPAPSYTPASLPRTTNSQERKYFDSSPSPILVVAKGNSTSLCNVAQGAGANQRIGRRIRVTSIGMHINLDLSSNETNGRASGRFFVILDTQNNSATAAADLAEYLYPSITGPPVETRHDQFRYLVNRQRFHTLHTEKFVLKATASKATEWGGDHKLFDFNKSFRPGEEIVIEYSGANGTGDEMTSNRLLFGIIRNDTLDGFYCTYVSRIRFTD